MDATNKKYTQQNPSWVKTKNALINLPAIDENLCNLGGPYSKATSATLGNERDGLWVLMHSSWEHRTYK